MRMKTNRSDCPTCSRNWAKSDGSNVNDMMKTIFSAAFLLLALVGATVKAQEPGPPGDPMRQPGRQGVLRRLGLSPEQMEQVRKVNQEKRGAVESAARRLREASRLLDEAVYADVADEATVNARLAEVQAAQSELSKIRTSMEFQIRRVLNPEQLKLFREMRRKDGARPSERPEGGPPPRRPMDGRNRRGLPPGSL